MIGATGKFPRGKIASDDEGELVAVITHDTAGNVRIDFGKPIAWFGMPYITAEHFAKALLEHVEKCKRNEK